MKKKFKRIKINNVEQYKWFFDLIKNAIKPWLILKFIILVCCIVIIFNVSIYAFKYWTQLLKDISISAVKLISSNIWEEMKTDELGQINILIVWYWWEQHQWWYLADTIMIASYNPKLGAVTFLSIPRDLYIKDKDSWYIWRINWLFGVEYRNTQDSQKASQVLIDELQTMTWIPIQYYALIDFKWFVKLIDKLGWIQIDVPEDLVDYQYPTEDGWYETFKVSKWINNFNWEIALKYARSRHSTSDFSRALRQQQVIKAIIKKIVSAENLTNINRIKSIYAEYKNMVDTNILLTNILWMVKYMDKINNFFSFVFTADCDWSDYSLMSPWCFLYYPKREDFAGMSILLPLSASAWDISNYKALQDFAFLTIYNQEYLIEDANIKILNWIDKKVLKQAYWYSYPVANKLAIDLVNNWFNVKEIWNTEKIYEKTLVYKNWTWDFNTTINLLKIFFNIDEVITWSTEYEWDLTIILGNDYVK